MSSGMLSTFVVGWLFLGLPAAVSAAYSCPEPPAPGKLAIDPSQAFQAQPTFLSEWIYVTGSLCIIGEDDAVLPAMDNDDGDRNGDGDDHGKGNGKRDEDNDSVKDSEDPIDIGVGLRGSMHERGSGRRRGRGGDFVNDCRNPLGFQLTSFNWNMSGGVATSPNNYIATSTVIAISYGDKHYTTSSLGWPPIYPNPRQTFDRTYISESGAGAAGMTVEYKMLSGVAGQPDSMYNFAAQTANASMNLLFRSLTPLMIQANGGYTGSAVTPLPPPKCGGGAYYVSMPQLSTSGVIRLNDKILFVSGLSWLDHEWGSSSTSASTSSNAAPAGWIWMGLRIGGVSVKLTVPHVNNSFLPTLSRLDVLLPNGTLEHGQVTALDVLSTWTSPVSKIVYPNHVSVVTTLPMIAQLVATPIFDNQEVGTMTPLKGMDYYWEGDVSISVVKGDCFGATRGNGYLELANFQPPASQ